MIKHLNLTYQVLYIIYKWLMELYWTTFMQSLLLNLRQTSNKFCRKTVSMFILYLQCILDKKKKNRWFIITSCIIISHKIMCLYLKFARKIHVHLEVTHLVFINRCIYLLTQLVSYWKVDIMDCDKINN